MTSEREKGIMKGSLMKAKKRFVFILVLLVSIASCSGPRSVTRRSELPRPTEPPLVFEKQVPPAIPPQPGSPVIKPPEPPQPSELPFEQKPSVPETPAVPAQRSPQPPAPVTPQSSAPPLSQPGPSPRPVTPAPAASPARARPQGQGVVFKFDNADLYEVVRTFAEVLKISYVIDPRVKGTVNIHTSGAISNDDIYPIFLSILRMNGATIVKKDTIYEIVPFSEGKKLPVTPDEKRRTAEDQFVIEIIKPNFIPITELEKVIKPFLSDEKELISFPQNNIVIIADLFSNIRKIREIMNLLDIDIFSSMAIRIYPVLNSDVNDMAKDLGSIFSAFGISSKEAKGGGVSFTPITRSNSLLVVSSMPGILGKVENWIKELDKPPADESKVWVQVYYVQNAKAKDLAEVLKQIYVKTKETRPAPQTPTPAPAPTPTPTTPRTTPTPARPTPAPTPAREEGARTVEGDINIVVDEQNNALVIRALYRDYKAILETIQKLDIYPKQVLIDVFLAEITLDDSLKYGIDWAGFFKTTGSVTHTTSIVTSPNTPVSAAAGEAATVISQIPYAGGGIQYAVVDAAGRFAAAISAAATDNRLKVVSSPHILASNNKEAKIQIGQEQPILTSTYTSTTISSSDVITGSIEYKDIGIILTVTPRISDAGLITIDLQVEDSTASNTTIGTGLLVPIFKKKTAKTTLSVIEGQMIVIGGLIGDSKTVNKSGIPFLSKIPVLGGLFGKQEYDDTKTETVLLMTPHIITDQTKSKAVTDEFQQRLKEIRKELEERERLKNK